MRAGRLSFFILIFSTSIIPGWVEYLSDYYMLKGMFEALKGNSSFALELFDKAITAAEDVRSARKLLKSKKLKADLYVEAGNAEKSLKIYDESIMLASRLEPDFEAAKGYYGKCMALKSLNRISQAESYLNKAKESISKVDECMWSDIIKAADSI